MLNVSENSMCAGVCDRSTCTPRFVTVALRPSSERDVTLELGTALLQLLAGAGPADFALVDDIMPLGKRDQGADVLFVHEDRYAFGPHAIDACPDLVVDQRCKAL